MDECSHATSAPGAGGAQSHGAPGGRALPPGSSFGTDDGSADPALAALLAQMSGGEGDLRGVVDYLRDARLLIPMLAELVTEGVSESGLRVDKEAATGVVAVATGDGRSALPVFTSVDSMARWHPQARPVPATGERAALSAVAEGWALLVLDPAGPVTAVIPRTAVWAMAKRDEWLPATSPAGVDGEVARAIVQVVTQAAPEVSRVECFADLAGADRIIVQVALPPLGRADYTRVMSAVNHALGASDIVADRIDALKIRVVRA